MFEVKPNCKLPNKNFIFRNDPYWHCVASTDNSHIGDTLPDLCAYFGVDLPFDCNYIFIRFTDLEFKLRFFGNKAVVYIHPLNHY